MLTINKSKQQGMVLVIGLIFLLVMTLLGISSLTSTSMSEHIASNMMNMNVSFQSAESSLRDAENWLGSQNIKPVSSAECEGGSCDVWQASILPDLTNLSHSWWQSNARMYSSSMGENVASPPCNIIEEQAFIPDDLSPQTLANGQGVQFYKITSRGTGSNDTADTIVQSVYATRYD